MNLISCDNCAVVFDKDKLEFTDDVCNSDDSFDLTKACYNGCRGEWMSYVPCPCCGHEIWGDVV